MSDVPTQPKRSPPFPDYSNGREPVSGVMRPRTGRTRNFVKWGSIIGVGIASLTALLTPISEAIAKRIAYQSSPWEEVARPPRVASPCDGGR